MGRKGPGEAGTLLGEPAGAGAAVQLRGYQVRIRPGHRDPAAARGPEGGPRAYHAAEDPGVVDPDHSPHQAGCCPQPRANAPFSPGYPVPPDDRAFQDGDHHPGARPEDPAGEGGLPFGEGLHGGGRGGARLDQLSWRTGIFFAATYEKGEHPL